MLPPQSGCFMMDLAPVHPAPKPPRSVRDPSRNSSSPTRRWSPRLHRTGGAVDPALAKYPTRSRMVAPTAPSVEQVWSRTAEWGPTFLVLLGWGAMILLLLYWAVSSELYGLLALIVGLGGLGAILLSYPLLITLERPVRITPEQAARDYFAALSHHLPHYRRMWLLLSARGRVSPQFASYEGFKNYWVKRLEQLRGGHAGRFSPLVFKVEDFRAEKSAGKTEIDAKFKVRVLVRGRQAEGPIWSFPVERSFARGPDGMWYLNDGTLAERPVTAPRKPKQSRAPANPSLRPSTIASGTPDR